jgi:methyltransferase (TIGR00027 family)
VVLLGAGFDCRALRFGNELSAATVFEVDHPSTQNGKIKQLPAETMRTRVVYVGWDFARDDMTQLPARLHEQGLDPSLPVLTIWEGVTMYLEPDSIESTVRAVRAFGAEQSLLAFTYIDRRSIGAPRGEFKLMAKLVSQAGEPWRFGWEPEDVPFWFGARGFSLVSDASDAELATRFLPARFWRHFARRARHLAIVSASAQRS